MIRYIIKRILSMVPSLLLTSILVFSFVHLIPGDPAITMLGDTATEEQLEVLREEMGLNQPLVTQYVIWLGKLLRGDMGKSIFQNRPVLACIVESSETSILLSIMAMVLILCISIPVGILSAVKANSWIDQAISSTAMFFASVPAFWLGLNLMLLFAVKLMLLPSSGFPSIASSGDWSNIRYLILPSVAIAIPNTAQIVRMTRSSMLDVIKEDYVRTAHSKGLTENQVYVKHVFRNSMIAVVSSLGIVFASLISGTVVTESVFALPGLGHLLITSINLRDYPLIQGIILVIAMIFMAINLIVDIINAKLDPRIRFSSAK
ncbi:MAG: ABC transporter permease [Candidatus Limiplasma sp.]|nr:ABC transporter permease [Candidatus Limiplasma sp.]